MRREVSSRCSTAESWQSSTAPSSSISGSPAAANGASIDCARPHQHQSYRRMGPEQEQSHARPRRLRLTGRSIGSMTFAPIQALHEPYAHLYVGDYFADTLDLTAHEHRALRLLLLETWVRGPVGNVRL